MANDIKYGGTLLYRSIILDLETPMPIFIGHDVYIGTDVIILPGVSIGNNVIIGVSAIVTTPVGAVSQILEADFDGRYGVMVSSGSVDEMRGSIVSLLGDEASESEMRKNVVRRVHERYEHSSVWL